MLSTGEMLVYCGVTILFIVLAYLIGYLVGVKTVIEKEDKDNATFKNFKSRLSMLQDKLDDEPCVQICVTIFAKNDYDAMIASDIMRTLHTVDSFLEGSKIDNANI